MRRTALLSRLGRRRAPSPRALPEAAPLSSVTFGAGEMQPLYAFRDIAVVPCVESEAMVLRGGPIWPDWPAAWPVRHQRNYNAVDRCPPDPAAPPDRIEAPVLWGGHVVPHFGHWLAEHATRILAATTQRPDDPLLFTLEPGKTGSDAPAFFWQTLDWLGVAPDRVRFVTRPVVAARLHAAPMAEQWSGVPPAPAYLDLLDANARRNRLAAADPRKTVYVARDGMAQRGEGNNAGESYLTERLQALGVSVIRPETMPLREQLKVYARAGTLVFAEGSALHGRQLLGRVAQHIVVLNRRSHTRIGHAALLPRCHQLSYCEATRGTIEVLWPNGRPWAVRAISIYDPAAMLHQFARLGIPLAGRWDDAAFRAVRDREVAEWMRIRLAPGQPIDRAASIDAVRKGLAAHGLDHLIEHLPDVPPA